jgi:hypothetical protein
MQISRGTLQRLLFSHEISPVVLEGVFSFGSKVTGEDDPYASICYWKTWEKHSEDTVAFENKSHTGDE